MLFEIATANDLPRLVELLSEPSNASTMARGVAYALDHPELGVILVVRNESRVMACAFLSFTVSTAEGGRVAVIQNFTVDHAFQGRGFGSRLLDDVFQYARENGLLRITLWVETLAEPVRQFFRERGFVDSGMIPLRQLL